MVHILGAVALAGLLLTPARLAAQETDTRNTEPPPPLARESTNKDVQDAKRFHPLMREMEELLQAGKFDELLQRVEKIRDIAKENPRFMALIERAIGERKAKLNPMLRKDAGPDATAATPRARIQHLRLAAEQLKLAGLDQLADQTRAQIGRIEAEAKQQEARRQQAQRQQAQRQQAGNPCDSCPDGTAAIKAEMSKLRRELEDLRNQLRHLKADAAAKPGPLPPVPPPHRMPPMEQPQ